MGGSTLTNAERREVLAHLVTQAQGQDSTAFETLVVESEGLARKLAHSIVGPNLVEDALQESYLLVFRTIGQLKTPEAFLGWLSRLVMRVCYRMKKRNPAKTALPTDLISEDSSQQVIDSLTLRRALAELKLIDREVLVLYELLDLDHEEVGYALRIPVGTARSRLYNARKRLSLKLRKPSS